MSSYAILRTAKLTSMGNLSGSLSHAYRTRPTHNADPTLTPANDLLIAPTQALAMQNFTDRLETVKTVRKNAVLAIEYLIAASPEAFTEDRIGDGKAYFDDAMEWLKQKHGEQNIISAVVHRDETSPHLSVFVIPINSEGKLNARQYLGGKKTLSDMQTDFAKNVGAKHGLSRGIERSGAEHTTIREFYATVNHPLPEIKTKIPEVAPPTPSQKLAEQAGIETEHSRAEREREQAIEQFTQEKIAHNKAILAKATQYDIEKPMHDQREKTLQKKQVEIDELKREKQELANRLREIPITEVLERLGAVQDRHDKSKWHTEAGEISTTKNDQRFNSFSEPTLKGRGALDLVMRVRSYSYQLAAKWLSDEFGEGQAVATCAVIAGQLAKVAIEKTPSPSPIPEPAPEHWQHVKDWLLNIRKLPEQIINELHNIGTLFADKYKNAVFVSRNRKSAEIVGTSSTTKFKGFRGEKTSMFSVGSGGKIAVVESAIDAISVITLGHADGAISTGGMLSQDQINMIADMQKRNEILIAFDNDEAGDNFAYKLTVLNGVGERLKSRLKDWNDDLKFEKTEEKTEQKVEPKTEKIIAEREIEMDRDYSGPSFG